MASPDCFRPAVVLQPPHGDGVYPPALIFSAGK
ncbi:hypothetical protein EC5412_2389, partial [Escherichia coli 5412]